MTKTKSTIKAKQDSRKTYSLSNPSVQKQHRKGRNPWRAMPTSRNSNSKICKIFACGAIQSIDDKFCSRCSCYICHGFNDTKDPTLWLVCKSSSSQKDSCKLICHIECALQRQRVGVVNHGKIMHLDGSYCCACGKVTEILGCWKEQLNIAKDTRQVDVLRYRINLSYKLLDGTSRFNELHEIVKKAKSTLEAAADAKNGMPQGKIMMLTLASEAQKLCSLAIEKADEWLTTISTMDLVPKEAPQPFAFSCVFEEITHSSVTILVIEMSNTSSEGIEGYKLLYYKSLEESLKNGPFWFSRAHRKIVISELQPCTEYTFCITSLTNTSDQAYCEVKRFTKSVDIFRKKRCSLSTLNYAKEDQEVKGSSYGSKLNLAPLTIDFSPTAQKHGTILPPVSAQEQGPIEKFCDVHIENFQKGNEMIEAKTLKEDHLPVFSFGPNLNASMPILNEKMTHTNEPFKYVDNDYALQSTTDVDGVDKINLARSHGVGASKTLSKDPAREKPIIDSYANVCGKRAGNIDEIFQKRHNNSLFALNYEKEDQEIEESFYGSKINPDPLTRDSSLNAQNHGTILPHASNQEQGPIEKLCDANIENFRGSEMIEAETLREDHMPVLSCGLNLNASMPILDEEATHTHKPSEDDDNDCALRSTTKEDGVEEINLRRLHGVSASKTLSNDPVREKPIIDSYANVCGKRAASIDEIFQKRHNNSLFTLNYEKEDQEIEGSSYDSKLNMDPLTGDTGLNAQNHEAVLTLISAQKQGPIEEFCDANIENFQGGSEMIEVETLKENQLTVLSCGLNLNDSMPILNEEVTHTRKPSKDDNDCSLQSAAEANGVEKINLARSHGVGASKILSNNPIVEKPIIDSCTDAYGRKTTSTDEICDNEVTSRNRSFLLIADDSNSPKENLSYYIRIFRGLEQKGHMTEEFRLKLLSWFCLRSTEQERAVVYTYIQTLIDDPSALVGQLVDSFGEIIARKSPRY